MDHASGTGFQFFANTQKNRGGTPVSGFVHRAPAAGSRTDDTEIPDPSASRAAPSAMRPRCVPPRDKERMTAVAGVAFEAWGATREELFSTCAAAVMNVITDDPGAIEPRERYMVSLAGEACDMLLFSLLHELILLKETQGLLLKIKWLAITEGGGGAFHLKAEAAGETIDPARHGSSAPFRGIALHRLSVGQRDGRWVASVAFDMLNK